MTTTEPEAPTGPAGTQAGKHRRRFEPRASEYWEWNVDRFVPAPDGWRLVFVDNEGDVTLRPLPGWIVQEEVAYSRFGAQLGQPDSPIRRIVAGVDVRGGICAASDEYPDVFYGVIGPWEKVPDAPEIQSELRRRQVMPEARAKRNGQERTT